MVRFIRLQPKAEKMKIEGFGTHQLHGLCPPTPIKAESDASILLINTGDPRYIVSSLCEHITSDRKTALAFCLTESSPTTMARQLIMLYMLFDSSVPPSERAVHMNQFHSNTMMTRDAAEYTREAASRVIEAVSNNSDDMPFLHSFRGTTRRVGYLSGAGMLDKVVARLTYIKEAVATPNDVIDVVKHADGKTQTDRLLRAFDTRIRRHYGDRYDHVRSIADYESEMCLKPLHDIVYSAHYRTWRETGIGYDHGYVQDWAGDADTVTPPQHLDPTNVGSTFDLIYPNLSMTTNFTESVSGKAVTESAYLGDIITGPFLSWGVGLVDGADDREKELLTKRQQGQGPQGQTVPSYCSMHVAYANLYRAMTMFDAHDAQHRFTLKVANGRLVYKGPNDPETEEDRYAPPLLKRQAVRKLRFTDVVVPCLYAQYIAPDLLQRACAPSVRVVVESPRYLFDLPTERCLAFLIKVHEVCAKTGLLVDPSLKTLVKKAVVKDGGSGGEAVVVDPEMTVTHLRYVTVQQTVK